MQESEIPENEKLEEYLNYVYQEEKKGRKFAEVQELLEDIGDYSRTVGVWGLPYIGIKTWLVGAAVVGVWIFMTVIFVMRVQQAVHDLNSYSVGAAVIWGMLVTTYGSGFLNYLRSRRR